MQRMSSSGQVDFDYGVNGINYWNCNSNDHNGVQLEAELERIQANK